MPPLNTRDRRDRAFTIAIITLVTAAIVVAILIACI